MSRIDELIAELCPTRVELKALSDVAEVGTGSSNGNESDIDGVYPFFVRSQMIKAKNTYEYNEEAIIIPGEGGIGDIFHYVNGKYALHQRVYRIHFLMDSINVRFVYYYMKAFFKQYILRKAVSATVTSIRKPMIEQFIIPVPPLPVQSEIVSILDNFTELTAELIARLTEELTARKKQYEYYRDNLLGIDGNEYFLEEVCQIVDCPHTSPKWKQAGVPVIRNYNLINGHIDTSNMSYVDEEEYQNRIKRITPQKDDILFSREAPIGNVGIVPESFVCCQGQRVVLLRPDQQIVMAKYLLYLLQGGMVKEQIYRVEKVGSTVSNFNIGDLKHLKVCIPPISIQKKIIEKLDVFSSLSANIAEGLPAEIAARQKQYEYYRNKLLFFKKGRCYK